MLKKNDPRNAKQHNSIKRSAYAEHSIERHDTKSIEGSQHKADQNDVTQSRAQGKTEQGTVTRINKRKRTQAKLLEQKTKRSKYGNTQISKATPNKAQQHEPTQTTHSNAEQRVSPAIKTDESKQSLAQHKAKRTLPSSTDTHEPLLTCDTFSLHP